MLLSGGAHIRQTHANKKCGTCAMTSILPIIMSATKTIAFAITTTRVIARATTRATTAAMAAATAMAKAKAN